MSPAPSNGASDPTPIPDSGLLCLLFVARYHGVPADGAQLRHQFGRAGAPLTDVALLRAAKHLGFKARVVDGTLENLATTPLPAIAKLTDGRCLIVAKIDGDKLLLHDPVKGRPLVQSREALTIWAGRLLLIAKRA